MTTLLRKNLLAYWLEFVNWIQYCYWNWKYTSVKNGIRNYSNWPRMHSATPEWKRRVRRVKKICELRRMVR